MNASAIQESATLGTIFTIDGGKDDGMELSVVKRVYRLDLRPNLKFRSISNCLWSALSRNA